MNPQLILPLTITAATVLCEFNHRSSPRRRLPDPRTRRNFDFGDFASSDSSYESLTHTQPSFDTGGYNINGGRDPPSPYHEQIRDSRSKLKADHGGTVNEFDNLTPYYGAVTGSNDATSASGDSLGAYSIEETLA